MRKKRPLADGSVNLSNRLRAVAVTQERSIALALMPKGDDPLREELSFAFGFVGEVEDLADVCDVVDIAWMSCAPNTLSSRLVAYCHRRRWSVLAPFRLLAEPELGPNP
jgi:hypothetical protein